MDISQAVAVRFWWNLYKMKFTVSVWLSAKLSFQKICGTEIWWDQAFAKWSFFSRKCKSKGNRRVDCNWRQALSIVGFVGREFVHQKLCVAQCISFESYWCKTWIRWEIENWSKFAKSDRCEHVVHPGAALPGAHILTDVHPTNGERSNSMACRDS